MVFSLVWLGPIYGAIDGLLLMVLPVYGISSVSRVGGRAADPADLRHQFDRMQHPSGHERA